MSQSSETILELPEATSASVWNEAYPKLLEIGINPDTDQRAEQVAGITGEGLQKLILDVHSAVAPDVPHAPTESAMHVQSPDGTNRRALMTTEDRIPFVEHAAELVRNLASQRSTPEDNGAFLRRAANVVALSVVLTHTYPDANGRTARTLAQFIREGLDPSDEISVSDMQALSANRPEKGFRINSYVPTSQGQNMDPAQLLDVAAALDIPLQDEHSYNQLKNDAFTTPYHDM